MNDAAFEEQPNRPGRAPLPRPLLEAGSWIDEILIRICVALQLTPTQYRAVESHYSAVSNWLSAPGSVLARVHQEIYSQGSLRIGTTVRPWRSEEYDLDLVLWLDLNGSLDPAYVLDTVEGRLREHGTYAPMVERKNRCVRLKFAGQFHLDILPARPDERFGGTHVLVPDRAAASWKESNPKGYASWFENRGLLAGAAADKRLAASVEPLPLPEEARDKNALQLAVQLLKRWRDVRFLQTPDLAPISIVLTTLAAQHYSGEARPFEALRAIVAKVNASIPQYGRLIVLNPANPLEDLSERWDGEPDAYKAFVRSMSELSFQLSAISETVGIPGSTREIERVFGAEPVQKALRSHALALEERRSAGATAVTRAGVLIATGLPETVPVARHTFYGA